MDRDDRRRSTDSRLTATEIHIESLIESNAALAKSNAEIMVCLRRIELQQEKYRTVLSAASYLATGIVAAIGYAIKAWFDRHF